MSDPIVARGAAGALPYSVESAPRGPAEPRGEFREALRATAVEEPPAPARELLRDAAMRIARGEQHLDRVMRQAERGGTLAPDQLIALQSTVYRYTQEVELAAKLVDKLTAAVKQTLTSQQ